MSQDPWQSLAQRPTPAPAVADRVGPSLPPSSALSHPCIALDSLFLDRPGMPGASLPFPGLQSRETWLCCSLCCRRALRPSQAPRYKRGSVVGSDAIT